MGPGVRYALLFGLVLGLAASAVMEVDGTTVLGHLRRGNLPPSFRTWLSEVTARAEKGWNDGVASAPADGSSSPGRDAGGKDIAKGNVKRPGKDTGTMSARNAELRAAVPKEVARRTDLLREAVAKSAPSPTKTQKSNSQAPASTRVDERITSAQKKKLSELLAPKKP